MPGETLGERGRLFDAPAMGHGKLPVPASTKAQFRGFLRFLFPVALPEQARQVLLEYFQRLFKTGEQSMSVLAIDLTAGHPRPLGHHNATASENVPPGQFYLLVQTGHCRKPGGFRTSSTLANRRRDEVTADGPQEIKPSASSGDQNQPAQAIPAKKSRCRDLPRFRSAAPSAADDRAQGLWAKGPLARALPGRCSGGDP